MISTETAERVLGQLGQVFSMRAPEEDGEDPIYVLRVESDTATRVFIGQRKRMLVALVTDGVYAKGAPELELLSGPAPEGFVYCVIDWGNEVTTLVYPSARTSSRKGEN